MGDKALIPWSEVSSWSCVACGNCCVGYSVPLKADEYARVAQRYGFDVVDFGLGKVYLKRGQNNRCVFQRPSMGRWICSLQGIKPLACKLFPFRIHSKPIYSKGDGSTIKYTWERTSTATSSRPVKGSSRGSPPPGSTSKCCPR